MPAVAAICLDQCLCLSSFTNGTASVSLVLHHVTEGCQAEAPRWSTHTCNTLTFLAVVNAAFRKTSFVRVVSETRN